MNATTESRIKLSGIQRHTEFFDSELQSAWARCRHLNVEDSATGQGADVNFSIVVYWSYECEVK
ncbi:hypothetical protein M758_3G244100 [Ceratodon purpureus]|uniref:Uncharacterized protein n=1 Tax=Ceratodon purpureus TaxID=3225 RepID=A0A8T0INZ7_CERPU|nr:hypothetical protein KC19_3G244000 [Ceratodon purpureus]KAG0624389.1 hypothetical protein M758_3G244100 [Ceratodon purpureus]